MKLLRSAEEVQERINENHSIHFKPAKINEVVKQKSVEKAKEKNANNATAFMNESRFVQSVHAIANSKGKVHQITYITVLYPSVL